LASPDKYASAIEQKNTLLEGTSVKGSVMLPAPHVPVSAFNWVETATITIITEVNRIALLFVLCFIMSFLLKDRFAARPFLT